MITSRKRPGRSLKEEIREVVIRNYLLSVRKQREKERVLLRRVKMMEDHRIEGRRRT